ncbi:hypothetical protein B0O80DRAFT_87257 [Mortierella sp. GBAus27b]|nr:hypothetical protein B0O80DRAFT_87257 [Mortierella sp. GBAus27b]
MAHIPHALSLPEVTFRVVQYLERDDFTACSLVCKPFYASYAPYLWGNVHLGVLLASEKRTPTFSRLIEGSCWNNCEALVRQNSDSLRSLTLVDWDRDPSNIWNHPIDGWNFTTTFYHHHHHHHHHHHPRSPRTIPKVT